MDVGELKKKVDTIRWFHTIDLGNGIVTPGRDHSFEKLKRIKMPTNLSDQTVLDIGAWDGFFSFEAEKRGAKRVLAIDSYVWEGGYCWRSGFQGTKRGFELARNALNSKVEDKNLDVFGLSPSKTGVFDLVLFLGVLYHLKHPLLALERVASVTGKQLILETHIDMLMSKRPAIVFYPKDELEGDPTNWCGPNPAAVVAMLKTVGFKKVKSYSTNNSFLYRLCKALYNKIKYKRSFLQTLQQSRMVFHAWK